MSFRQHAPKVMFLCQECGRTVRVHVVSYGRFGGCPDGCFGSFRNVKGNTKYCEWDPGRNCLARDIGGGRWHMGCESLATHEQEHEGKLLKVCQSCAEILAGVKDPAPIIEAFDEYHKMFDAYRKIQALRDTSEKGKTKLYVAAAQLSKLSSSYRVAAGFKSANTSRPTLWERDKALQRVKEFVKEAKKIGETSIPLDELKNILKGA